ATPLPVAAPPAGDDRDFALDVDPRLHRARIRTPPERGKPASADSGERWSVAISARVPTEILIRMPAVMSSVSAPPAPTANVFERLKQHPKRFWYIFWGELAERASFYGMRTVL